MRTLCFIMFAAALAGAVSAQCVAAQPDDAGQNGAGSGPALKCLQAVVNPVSGHAECVNPRGVAVAQPQRPPQPCLGPGCSKDPPKKEQP
jgi:hypothetical protein